MIKRFEYNVWILVVVMVAVSAVTIVVFPDTANAQGPTEGSPEVAEGAVPAPPATSVGSFTGGYDYKRQLPGLVIAALIFGIAVFSAWKLPMSHEAGNSSSHTGVTPEGIRGRGILAARFPAGIPEAGQDSSGSAWSIGGVGSPVGGVPEPTGAAGTTGITPSGGSRREEHFEALTGKLEALRRIVEEQDRRLAAMEEENFDLRRKIEAPPSLMSASRGTITGRVDGR